jgi:hypothetical protein
MEDEAAETGGEPEASEKNGEVTEDGVEKPIQDIAYF